jgi:hypothetical protein
MGGSGFPALRRQEERQLSSRPSHFLEPVALLLLRLRDVRNT